MMKQTRIMSFEEKRGEESAYTHTKKKEKNQSLMTHSIV